MLIPTDLLRAALYCASSEETRRYLRGVYLSTSGHMVATDGHRMFVARLAEAPADDVIVPLDAIKAALKLAPKKAEMIGLNGNTIGGVVFTPVDGPFPDWKAVTPPIDGYPPGEPEHMTPAHFNPEYIYDLGQMARTLGSKTSGSFKIHAWHNENAHGVTFNGRADCFAVIMPLRNLGNVTPWNEARAIA